MIRPSWNKASSQYFFVNSIRLHDYLLYDSWLPENAIYLLAGFDYLTKKPETSKLMKWAKDNAATVNDDDMYIRSECRRLLSIWNSSEHNDTEKYSPTYFIDWALSKNFKPAWLDIAINKGLYIPLDKRWGTTTHPQTIAPQITARKTVETKPSANSNESNAKADNTYKSDKLAILNQASTKFWGNADRADRTTHPINNEIESWLIERGYSATLAASAATIIRPEWAGTGRKPDK